MAGEREQGPMVAPPASAPEKVTAAREFCEGLLGRMGALVDIQMKETPEAIQVSLTPKEGNSVELGSALLEAAQYLVNRVVNPRAEGRKWVNLEVGGFREESDPVVQAMAERLAASARRMGKIIAIGPISARERRQIHLALVDADGVSTRSEGEGLFRMLLIVPESAGRGRAAADGD